MEPIKIGIPGVYKISSEIYHADPCIEPSLSRSTVVDLLFRSPAHAAYNHPRLTSGYEPEEDQKFDLGTAAHALLLEGVDNVAVIDAEDWRKKEAKEARDIARGEGKTPLLKRQYIEAKLMVAVASLAITGCPELKIDSLVNDGDAELSYLWKEKIQGFDKDLWLKARPDWISKDRKLILDYKTTQGSANPMEWDRQAVNMGYGIQAALYSRGVKTIEGTDPNFIFVVQEAYEPYICSFIGLLPDFMEMGKSKVDYALFLWQECLTLNKWPGYPNRVAWINAPAWALASWEQRATEIGI